MATIGSDVLEAARLLMNGELVAIPTETVYGLAANALNEEAITQVFVTKNRPFFDPLIVHISSFQDIEKYAQEVDRSLEKLMEEIWPGPLTVLLPKRSILSDIISNGLPRVAFRMPNHALTQELLSMLPFPLVAPSANPFKYISPTSAAHVNQQLGDKIPYILDGGNCMVGMESTIVGVENGEIQVYRKGGFSIENLEDIVGKKIKLHHSTSNPAAPGMLDVHYSPSTKLIIGNIPNLIKKYGDQRPAILSFSEDYSHENHIDSCMVLSPSQSLDEAAKNFFGTLRMIDDQGFSLILSEFVPEEGLGRAINDRLRRAGTVEY
ncbi:MAG TPA: L-threonylcarbamoyladenylate synthase [Saprospiraceae bacterium]|nr:L-threonylcarbamoyladenylate synthase [Saprospiraceae bacterium]